MAKDTTKKGGKIMKYLVRTLTTVTAGNVVELCVCEKPIIKQPRRPRAMPTDPDHNVRNITAVIRKGARLLNTNFTPQDYYVTLTYSEEAQLRLTDGMPAGLTKDEQTEYIYEQARKELNLCLGRSRYACKAAGVELRYLGVTADRDCHTQEPVRIHHHIAVNREAAEILIGKWRNGRVDKEHLYNEPDHYNLANYMIKQSRYGKRKACYARARNLREPVITVEFEPDKLALPEGACVIVARENYIRYYME